ncbi:ComEA family DNA-binding protein [Dyadobacter tibetensis]|uniref:ComEA family DNA-binding protein n=1 Tax=Dyadobacter tibetensis TaxID=1211851 RepID=UPI000A04DAB7|nr:helix-hairpin-helix domain-containing protein [Dyadobacter tibetensis]
MESCLRSTSCCLITILLLGSTLLVMRTYAQEPPRPEINLAEFVQQRLPLESEASDQTDLFEALLLLYTNPLDLNRATADELAAIMLLSDTQILSFLTYRSQVGTLLSVYELQAVPGFDMETIQNLVPFVMVQMVTASLRESFRNPTQHFLMVRTSRILESQKGFGPPDSSSRSSARYEGPAWNGYLRYRKSRAGSYSIGFTLDKDAGERPWTWNPQKHMFGMDYSSFHAQLMNRGFLKNIVVGDYQVQAGQGLVLAAGFSLGMGSEVIRSTYRSSLGVRPYTSAMEANYFRGAASTFMFGKNTEATLFVSSTRRDASLGTSLADSSQILITSLVSSGYHRTPAERQKQGIIPERNMGMHLLHRFRAGQVGLTSLYTHYSLAIQKRNVPYNRFEFSGKDNFVVGLHANYLWQNLHFFGEGARSQSGGMGAVAGIIAGMGKTIDFSLLLRYYGQNFHTFYGRPLSESSRAINERGAYWGLRFSPNRHWQVSAYYDHFTFPWLKYLINSPSDGHTFYFHTLYKPNKRVSIYSLYQEKHKERNLPNSPETIPPIILSMRRAALVNFQIEKPMKYLFRTRFQYGTQNYVGYSRSHGFTLVQDATWKFGRGEISGRVAIFNTDDYDSRQYVYEKDVLYAFSIPAYYDVGTRHYVLMKYNVTKELKLWLRWSQTRYKRLETIGSGLSEIQGNTRSDLKLQVLYQF